MKSDGSTKQLNDGRNLLLKKTNILWKYAHAWDNGVSVHIEYLQIRENIWSKSWNHHNLWHQIKWYSEKRDLPQV